MVFLGIFSGRNDSSFRVRNNLYCEQFSVPQGLNLMIYFFKVLPIELDKDSYTGRLQPFSNLKNMFILYTIIRKL